MSDSSAVPMHTVLLPRGPAAVMDVGSGPPVVCVHGLPGAARDFRWLLAPLAAHARLIAVDLPGFGRTPVGTVPDASP